MIDTSKKQPSESIELQFIGNESSVENSSQGCWRSFKVTNEEVRQTKVRQADFLLGKFKERCGVPLASICSAVGLTFIGVGSYLITSSFNESDSVGFEANASNSNQTVRAGPLISAKDVIDNIPSGFSQAKLAGGTVLVVGGIAVLGFSAVCCVARVHLVHSILTRFMADKPNALENEPQKQPLLPVSNSNSDSEV